MWDPKQGSLWMLSTHMRMYISHMDNELEEYIHFTYPLHLDT